MPLCQAVLLFVFAAEQCALAILDTGRVVVGRPPFGVVRLQCEQLFVCCRLHDGTEVVVVDETDCFHGIGNRRGAVGRLAPLPVLIKLTCRLK